MSNVVAGTLLMSCLAATAAAAAPASKAAVVRPDALPRPHNAPAYFGATYLSALSAPLPRRVYNQGGVPATVRQFELNLDSAGFIGNYQPAGDTATADNAFFQPLGTNGRACVTCHQPPSGMSVNLENIQARFNRTHGQDPLFSPVDGATCPNQVPAAETSASPIGAHLGSSSRLANLRTAYSLLLNKGLFRVFLPVPKQTIDNPSHPVEFTISVVSDPYSCNTDPAFSQVTDPLTGETSQIISVYRRPRASANLRFVTTTTSTSPVIDPATGLPISGNIMWDGREPTLKSQVIDATLGHAQALTPPTPEQIAQIVAFENGIFTAQAWESGARMLNGDVGAGGGSVLLSAQTAGIRSSTPFTLFDNWASLTGTDSMSLQRLSIQRGQDLFNNRKFTIANVAGLNDRPNIGNPLQGSCGGCHSQQSAGSSAGPNAQRDIGIGGGSTASGGPEPASDLPVFQITCNEGFTTPFNGSTVLTNDPGLALITGRCADIGRFTVTPLRGLASQAPYFSDGSAATPSDVVDFYDRRFSIGFSAQEKQDLINFLNAL